MFYSRMKRTRLGSRPVFEPAGQGWHCFYFRCKRGKQCAPGSMYDLRWPTINVFFTLRNLLKWNRISKVDVSVVVSEVRCDCFEETAFFLRDGCLVQGI